MVALKTIASQVSTNDRKKPLKIIYLLHIFLIIIIRKSYA